MTNEFADSKTFAFWSRKRDAYTVRRRLVRQNEDWGDC